MKILITNDDGIEGEGLNPLITSINKIFKKIMVVVPDRERSAISQAITLNSPIKMQKISSNFFTIDGTPTDCIYLTLLGAFKFTPDIVISGINKGPNLGEDILYSGTVAAAREAVMANIKSFAISINAYTGKIYFNSAAKIAMQILKILTGIKLPKGIFFNVNVPNLPYKEIKGIKVTSLGSRRYYDKLIKKKAPDGNYYFWTKNHKVVWQNNKETDYYAIKNNYVSITPLHYNLTAYEYLETLKKTLRGNLL